MSTSADTTAGKIMQETNIQISKIPIKCVDCENNHYHIFMSVVHVENKIFPTWRKYLKIYISKEKNIFYLTCVLILLQTHYSLTSSPKTQPFTNLKPTLKILFPQCFAHVLTLLGVSSWDLDEKTWTCLESSINFWPLEGRKA